MIKGKEKRVLIGNLESLIRRIEEMDVVKYSYELKNNMDVREHFIEPPDISVRGFEFNLLVMGRAKS